MHRGSRASRSRLLPQVRGWSLDDPLREGSDPSLAHMAGQPVLPPAPFRSSPLHLSCCRLFTPLSPPPHTTACSGLRTGSLSWPQMRRAGAGLWLLDPAQCRAQAEALARAQFARYRDPHECMLMYLALGKRAVLHPLFRQVCVRGGGGEGAWGTRVAAAIGIPNLRRSYGVVS